MPPGGELALVWPAAAVGYLWLLWSAHHGSLRRNAVLVAVMSGGLNFATGAGAEVALAFALANVVPALVAVLVVLRFSGSWRLRTAPQLFVLVAASVAGAATGAVIGCTAMTVLLDTDLASTFAAWVVRNASNAVVFGAVALRLAGDGWRSASCGRSLPEWTAMTVLLALFYSLVFAQPDPLPTAFIVLPLSVWVGLRFSTTAVAAHVLLGGLFVVSLTAAGYGPFQAEGPVTRVILAPGLVLTVALVALTLAVHRDEREQLLAQLNEQHESATVAGVPIALISLVDEHRQWFRAPWGVDQRETSKDVSFCAHLVDADAELHVHDATADPRFVANPIVAGEVGIRSYAGFPLRTPDGYVLGSLCVVGYRTASLDDGERQVLRVLARQVSQHLTATAPMTLVLDRPALVGAPRAGAPLVPVARSAG